MRISVPIVVSRTSSGERRLHTASTLSGPRHVATHVKLAGALEKLSQLLLGTFRGLAREGREAEIAEAAALPSLSQQRVELRLDLPDRTLRGRPLLLTFESFGRKVAFTPAVPDAWFTLERGADLATRAVEVLTEHFKRRLSAGEEELVPESLGEDPAWLTHLELELERPRKKRDAEKEERERARLGPEGGMDGEEELRKVGRRLEGLGLEGLSRALFREREVAELGRYVEGRRPVLLVGAPGAGKTAILHELVRRRLRARSEESFEAPFEAPYRRPRGPSSKAAGPRGSTWLVSPGRLISGMSYVGQWEDRLLSILRAAAKRGHTLYVDDLVGLFFAGRSSQSSLSVAHVLLPWLDRREVAIAGEITPEALRVLRETHRGFADAFHLIPVREPSEADALRVLLHLSRALEEEHACRFRPDALLEAFAMGRRWVHDRAFPGKVVPLLSSVARRSAGAEEPIGPGQVREELERTSGLTASLAAGSLSGDEVARRLAERITGQPAAIRAAAEVAGIASAQLADPRRPLASLLFLGPTGVGKTQLAKELARILFAEEGQLVRFDMNELSTPGSAARLVGTPDEPEGLLTSALRRQPWCVLLLDEIEKADPAVLDLLLQVLEDGRLTDALGRTADFTTALIVLTSNLGAREAASGLGFSAGGTAGPSAPTEAPSSGSREAVYRRAAERFFRPELLNRFDRIVVFDPLKPEELRAVARRVLSEAASREGFRRRHACLDVHPAALERVAAEGYHPQLGARALKRVVERLVVQPVAARLSVLPADLATVVRVSPARGGLEGVDGVDGVEGLDVSVTELSEAPRVRPLLERVDLGDPRALLEGLEAFVLRVREDVLRGPLDLSDPAALSPEARFALHARELAASLAESIESARDRRQALRVGIDGSAVRSLHREESRLGSADGWEGPRRSLLRQLLEARDAREALAEMARSGRRRASHATVALEALVLEAAYLQTLLTLGPGALSERALVLLRAPADSLPLSPDFFGGAWAVAARLSGEALAPEVTAGPSGGACRAVVVEGPAAVALAAAEAGTHLFWRRDGASVPLQLWSLPLSPSEDAAERVRAAWKSLGAGPEPYPYGPVVRVGTEDADSLTLLDVRSGLSLILKGAGGSGANVPAPAWAEDLWRLIASPLHPPPELEA